MIPKESLKPGFVYWLSSRNLSCGAYDGQGGFVGIRNKFDDDYLDVEYYREASGGSAAPLKEVCRLPDGVVPVVSLGTVDSNTDRPVAHDKDAGWVFTDTGERGDGNKIWPCMVENSELFLFLDSLRLITCKDCLGSGLVWREQFTQSDKCGSCGGNGYHEGGK